MKLKGKVALVTGSTGDGMGRSTAFMLAANGADIVLNYGSNRTDGEAKAASKAVEKAIRAMDRRVILIKADTKKEADVAAMVERAVHEFGKIDILINNASGPWEPRDYTEIDFEHWRNAVSSQIDSVFLMSKYIVPGMRQQSWGRIVNIGISGALRMENVKHIAADYCLGKAARAWMTTAFGLQEFSKGITVNCIEPGPTAHMTFEDALKAARGDRNSWQKRQNVTCHDIAEIIAFLCSDAARFISGSTIRMPTT